MNVVDVAIILACLIALQRGLRLGLLRLALSAIGFIAGLYVGSLAAGFIGDSIADTALRIVTACVLCIFAGTFLAGAGEVIGIRLGEHVRRIRLGGLDKLLGAGFEIVFVLIASWLISSVLSNVSVNNVGREIRGSQIVSTLNAKLPPAPDILSELERVIGASGMPKVFIGNEPSHTPIVKDVNLNTPAIIEAQKSVVKIESQGCGGTVDGSGFVVRAQVVATNAHVVAGITHPYVMTRSGTFPAMTIYFDPNLDFALLYVPRLDVPALAITTQSLTVGTGTVIMGYPGGGPLTISGGVVLNQLSAIGRSIYDRGIVTRAIYEVQGEVQPGNSGGPLLDQQGHVVGIIFAKSVTNDKVGYALLTNQIASPLEQYGASRTEVYTGRCASE